MKPTILVVDDEPAIVEVVCEALHELEVTPIACSQGQAVVPCAQRYQPQLVLLDIQMPVIDGVEVFQRMRADPLTRAIPSSSPPLASSGNIHSRKTSPLVVLVQITPHPFGP